MAREDFPDLVTGLGGGYGMVARKDSGPERSFQSLWAWVGTCRGRAPGKRKEGPRAADLTVSDLFLKSDMVCVEKVDGRDTREVITITQNSATQSFRPF